jgi:hypothetical protein
MACGSIVSSVNGGVASRKVERTARSTQPVRNSIELEVY